MMRIGLVNRIVSFHQRITVLILVALFVKCSVYAQKKTPLLSEYRHIGLQQGLPSSETYLVYQDRQGYMWFCTDRGVVRYDGFRMEVFTTNNGLLDNVVFKVYEDWKGRVWFLGFNDKLCYYENNRIIAYKYNAVLKKHNKLIGPSKTMYIDKFDNLYFGTYTSGIIKINRFGKCESNFIRKEYITLNLIDEKGEVVSGNGPRMIGDSLGILWIWKNGKCLKEIRKIVYRPYASLKKTKFMDVVRFDYHFFDLKNPEDCVDLKTVTGFFLVGGEIWITTTDGAIRFTDLRNGFMNAPREVFLEGIMISSVSKDQENGFWFSSLDNGIYYLPNKKIRSTETKQIGLKRIIVNDSVLDLKNGKEVVLNNDAKFINLELRSTNYKSLGNQKYKFRLSKKDSWSYGTSGKLNFYDLKSGEYQLEISYLNENGIWQTPYEILKIRKLPRFIETFWFYLLLILGSASIAFVILRTRSIRLNKQLNFKREIEKIEQQALLSQMNPHFIFNALNSIQSFLIYRENDSAEKYLLNLSELIRMTLSNSQKSEIPIHSEIDVLKKYLELEKMRFKDRFRFKFEVLLSEKEQEKSIPPMLIQPFVENSIIHGFKGLKEGGEIQVSFLKIENQVLSVEIKDNGVGYQNSSKKVDSGHQSYGTKITSERLNLYKQKYAGNFNYSIETLMNSNGESIGTSVRMIIPIITSDSF